MTREVFNSIETESVLNNEKRDYDSYFNFKSLFLLILFYFLFIFLNIYIVFQYPNNYEKEIKYYELNNSNQIKMENIDFSFSPINYFHKYIFVNFSLIRLNNTIINDILLKFNGTVLYSKDNYVLDETDPNYEYFIFNFLNYSYESSSITIFNNIVDGYNFIGLTLSILGNFTNLKGFNFIYYYYNSNLQHFIEISKLIFIFIIIWILYPFFNLNISIIAYVLSISTLFCLNPFSLFFKGYRFNYLFDIIFYFQFLFFLRFYVIKKIISIFSSTNQIFNFIILLSILIYCYFDFYFYKSSHFSFLLFDSNSNRKFIDIIHFIYNFFIIFSLFFLNKKIDYKTIFNSFLIFFISLNHLLFIFFPYFDINFNLKSFYQFFYVMVDIISSIFFIYFEKNYKYLYFYTEQDSDIQIEIIEPKIF